MNLFEELEKATTEQHVHGDLPQWLADPVLAVARSPERYAEKEYLVELLLAQIKGYDIYAETGCCKWAYDHNDITRTLGWLEGK